jgi:formylglycine-generating enzyme required for sulfatase activity/tRNA A-37 threonylcarbamoyl transferase component Bud32
VTCPRCGSTLHSEGQRTALTRCPNCQADLSGEATAAFELSPPPSEELPDVPGFEVIAKIDGGGMGTVFRARQLNPDRPVAIKVLHAELARQRIFLQRFEREAKLAANLNHPNLVAVFDVKEAADGRPAIIMPLIEGADLRKIIKARRAARAGETQAPSHPWARLSGQVFVDRMLAVLDQVVAATAALHGARVLHRDIKPGNVLVDKAGHAWLGDFGLARQWDDGLAMTGPIGGTVGYAGPEQCRGEPPDERSDVFCLGATIYQALTLELPFGKAGSLHAVNPAADPRARQRRISRDMSAVISKALELDPAKRYPSAAELYEDWQQVRQFRPPRHTHAVGPVRRLVDRMARHRRAVIACAAAALILLMGGAMLGALSTKERPALRTVRVLTEPPGARVALVRLSEENGLPYGEPIQPTGTTPLTVESLPPGDYLVEAAIAGRGFQEAYRRVATIRENALPGRVKNRWQELSDSTLQLDPIVIPVERDVTAKMARFQGGEFSMGTDELHPGIHVGELSAHRRAVSAFYLDTTEVTVADFRKTGLKLYDKFARDRPGELDAVRWVTFWEAAYAAEALGKRLPTEVEWEYAATNGGKTRFPWGDDDLVKEWKFGPVKLAAYDRTPTDPPVYGLFSNAAEWTLSPYTFYPGRSPVALRLDAQSIFPDQFRGNRIIRGGPPPVTDGEPDPVNQQDKFWEPRYRLSSAPDNHLPGAGFRCARSAQPQFLQAPRP